MKMHAATKETDSKYSEKIKKLTAMYHDKSLSRKEKQEVRRELNHLKYLADPRPVISMRKQTVLSIVAFLIMTVNSISAKCGYVWAYYFAKCFKEATGMTPLQYRKERHRHPIAPPDASH